MGSIGASIMQDSFAARRPGPQSIARPVPRPAGADGLRTVTVRDFGGLAPHRSAWDRLAWEAPQMVPTLLPAWVEASLRTGLIPSP